MNGFLTLTCSTKRRGPVILGSVDATRFETAGILGLKATTFRTFLAAAGAGAGAMASVRDRAFSMVAAARRRVIPISPCEIPRALVRISV